MMGDVAEALGEDVRISSWAAGVANRRDKRNENTKRDSNRKVVMEDVFERGMLALQVFLAAVPVALACGVVWCFANEGIDCKEAR